MQVWTGVTTRGVLSRNTTLFPYPMVSLDVWKHSRSPQQIRREAASSRLSTLQMAEENHFVSVLIFKNGTGRLDTKGIFV